ncbi:type I-E CRISPR-associated protein Cas6/Cse3/CasE (plasmid) [Streptomyces sp. NBC_00464]|uniref:type I-E CRISPR-associated protein Cas6/Cse3/CasE n=1 Tax=Streptomyces sp. NBC_00464 TaxID=2975751 RepID=UPI002E1831FF
MSPSPAVLARIRLNPHHRAVQRDIHDADQMHKTLMRMVPDHLGDHARQQTGLLYRLDTDDDGHTLLVQAAHPLNTAGLPHGYGNADTRELAPMFQALHDGLGVRYRIVVNPIKRERLSLDRKNERGRTLPLSGPDADQWWQRRATASGLQLHTLTPHTIAPARSRTAKPGMRHSLIRYDGTATITDTHALTNAVLTGIGRGKSYGAGLLSLAPAPTP